MFYILFVFDLLLGIIYIWLNDLIGISFIILEVDVYVVIVEDSLGCIFIGDILWVYVVFNIGQVILGCFICCCLDMFCFLDLDGVSNFVWYFNGEFYFVDSLLVAIESGIYQFYVENDIGCFSISELLGFIFYDGVGMIIGEVVLDLNENGVVDVVDSLLSGVVIDWLSLQWGNGVDMINENGFIILFFVFVGGYQLVLDESFLDFLVIEGIVIVYDIMVMGCDNDYSFIWLLIYLVCVNIIDMIQVV